MPSALLLTPELRFPPTGGGTLRMASIYAYLAANYHVDVILFQQPGDAGALTFPKDAKPARVLEIPLAPNSRTLAAKAVRNLDRLRRRVPPLIDRLAGHEERIREWTRGRRYDLAWVEHFWCAPYLTAIEDRVARTILDLQNIESLLHDRCAAAENFAVAFAHRRFAREYRKLEAEWLPRYGTVFTPSDADRREALRLAPSAPVHVLANTLAPVEARTREETDAIVFTGNLEYHPNVRAVRFFSEEIWPGLRARFPRLRWRLVGQNPHAVRRWTENVPGVEVTGAVPDALAELARARVAVVPLLSGSGTRLKILEAWATACPVVSTTVGAEGLGAAPGEHLLIADQPAAFASSVTQLLEDDSLRERVGAAGRRLFEEKFTWRTAWEQLTLCGI